jgi:hypothetical protein
MATFKQMVRVTLRKHRQRIVDDIGMNNSLLARLYAAQPPRTPEMEGRAKAIRLARRRKELSEAKKILAKINAGGPRLRAARLADILDEIREQVRDECNDY